MSADLLYVTAPILSAVIPLAVFLIVMERNRGEGKVISRLKGQLAFGACGICTATPLSLWAILTEEFAIALMGAGLILFFFAMAVISDALLSVAKMDPMMIVGGKCRV